MSLATVELLVKEKADQSSDMAFGLLFSKLKNQHIASAHLTVCDCTYCSLLRQYAVAKIRLHHLRKRFYTDDISLHDIDSNSIYSCQMSTINKLKKQKDRAKLS